MRKYILFLLLFLCQLASALNVDEKIYKGFIINQLGEHIAFANVIMLSKTDSTFICGTASNENGEFTLSVNSDKDLLLKITYIGYQDIYIPIDKNETKSQIGNYTLIEQTIGLSEVKVTAKKAVIQMTPTSLILNVSNTPMGDMGTAIDVLKYIPGLVKIGEDYKVLGKGTPEIYIDGKRSNISELQLLNSNNIDKIELVKNPDATYNAETRAVIKVITKKRYLDGFELKASVQGKYSGEFMNNEYIFLNYRIKKLNLFANYMHDLSKSNETYISNQINKGDSIWKLNQRSTYKKQSNSNYFWTGFNYDFNLNHSVGLQYNLSLNPFLSRGNEQGNYYEIYANNTLYDSTHQNYELNTMANRQELSAYYRGKLSGKIQLQWDGAYLRNYNNTTQSVRENIMNVIDSVQTVSKNTTDVYASKLLLNYNMSENNSVSVGVDWSLVNRSGTFNNLDFKVVPDNNYSNYEDKKCGFITYSTTIGKLNGSVGLRYEYVNSLAKEYDTTVVNKNYSELFPSLSLSYPLSDFQMSLNFNSRVGRPSFSQLNNNVQYNSYYHYEKGNPFLTSQKIYELSYGIGHDIFQLSLNYQYIKDFITLNMFTASNTDAVTIVQAQNFPDYQLYSAQLSASPKIGLWSSVISAGIFKQQLNVISENGSYNYNHPYANFSINNIFSFPKDYIFTVDASWTTKGSMDILETSPFGSFDFGLQKFLFEKKLALSLQCLDIFKWQDFHRITYMNNIYLNNYSQTESRYVYLKITLNLNKYKNKYNGSSAAKDEKERL